MTLNDRQVIDIVDTLCDQAKIAPERRVQKLREHQARTVPDSALTRALAPLVDRYLAIVDPPRLCQIEHDHWEGKMICGNPLPCRTHGGR